MHQSKKVQARKSMRVATAYCDVNVLLVGASCSNSSNSDACSVYGAIITALSLLELPGSYDEYAVLGGRRPLLSPISGKTDGQTDGQDA